MKYYNPNLPFDFEELIFYYISIMYVLQISNL